MSVAVEKIDSSLISYSVLSCSFSIVTNMANGEILCSPRQLNQMSKCSLNLTADLHGFVCVCFGRFVQSIDP